MTQLWWNVDNATHNKESLDLETVCGSALRGFFFRPDGLAFYVLSYTHGSVFEYTLFTAWDISTATYSGNFVSVSGSGSNLLGLSFSSDGSYMFVLIAATDSRVYQYEMFVPWDISNAVYGNKNLYVGDNETNPTSLYLKSDGLKFFLVGSGADRILEYTLTSAFDISTGSYSTRYYYQWNETPSPSGIFVKSDGLKVFVLDGSYDKVCQYILSQEWNPNSIASLDTSFSVRIPADQPRGLSFKPDGSSFFVLSTDTKKIHEFSLGEGVNVTFISKDSNNNIVGCDGIFDDYSAEEFQLGSFSDTKCSGDSIVLSYPVLFEDFEDETLAFTITGSWTRTETTAYEGTFALESPNKNHNSDQSSYLTFPKGDISFYYRVSSEEGWDKLYIYLNDVVQVDGISGDGSWTLLELTGTEDINTLRFRYTKDGSVSKYLDAGFIDSVTFFTSEYDTGTFISASTSVSSYGITGPNLKIKWDAIVPTNTSIIMETGVSDDEETIPTVWHEQTNGTIITDLPADLTGKFLWYKATLESTDGESTPELSWVVIYDAADNPVVASRLVFNEETQIVSTTGSNSFIISPYSTLTNIPYTSYVLDLEGDLIEESISSNVSVENTDVTETIIYTNRYIFVSFSPFEMLFYGELGSTHKTIVGSETFILSPLNTGLRISLSNAQLEQILPLSALNLELRISMGEISLVQYVELLPFDLTLEGDITIVPGINAIVFQSTSDNIFHNSLDLEWLGVSSSFPTKKLFTLDYFISSTILPVLFEQIYGLKFSREFDLYYEDKPIPLKRFELSYQNAPLSVKRFNLLYDTVQLLTKRFNLDYKLLSDIHKRIEQIYSLTEDSVSTIFDLPYPLVSLNKIQKVIKSPYYLLDGSVIQYKPSVNVLINSVAVDFIAINLTISSSQYCFIADIQIASESNFNTIESGDIVTIEIDIDKSYGETYTLFVETKSKIMDINQRQFMIQCLSPTAKLDKPYSTSIVKSYGLDTLASVIILEMAAKQSIIVDNQLIDWLLDKDSFYIQDETPIEVIRRIVSSVGGIIQTKPNGDLLIISDYPVSPKDWNISTPDRVISIDEEVLNLTETPIVNTGYNAFIITDENATEGRIWLEQKSLDSGKVEIRGFRIPFDEGEFDLETSRDVPVTISKDLYHIETQIPEVIEEDDPEWEYVEFIEWEGKTQYPIYEIIDYIWKDVNLGSISFKEEGQLTIDSYDPDTNPSESLLKIKYKTKYWRWEVVGPIDTYAQIFVPKL